jgi:class 3 adenylate cyclase
MRIDRALAFVDLCQFTAYTDAHGDHAAVAVLAQLRSTLEDVAAYAGVRVTKWLGDGALVCGLDVRAVARCVLDCRDELAERSPLPLRGAVARGDVIPIDGGDFVGEAVRIASTLLHRARPNQVLATRTVAEQLHDLVTMRPCPALRMRGIPRGLEVHELLGPASRRQPSGESA